jgi:hypothetical protein
MSGEAQRSLSTDWIRPAPRKPRHTLLACAPTFSNRPNAQFGQVGSERHFRRPTESPIPALRPRARAVRPGRVK